MTHLTLLLFLLCFPLSSSTGIECKSTIGSISHKAAYNRQRRNNGITKEKAISIANKDAGKHYGALSHFRIVPCEQTRFWRIIYDGGGPEYVIDKTTGIIIRRQKIPQEVDAQSKTPDSTQTNATIDKQKAIEIAKKDALITYGDKEDVEKYVVFACEQAKVWRVIFDYQSTLISGQTSLEFPNGSTPKYVIDKTTGKVIHRQRN